MGSTADATLPFESCASSRTLLGTVCGTSLKWHVKLKPGVLAVIVPKVSQDGTYVTVANGDAVAEYVNVAEVPPVIGADPGPVRADSVSGRGRIEIGSVRSIDAPASETWTPTCAGVAAATSANVHVKLDEVDAVSVPPPQVGVTVGVKPVRPFTE